MFNPLIRGLTTQHVIPPPLGTHLELIPRPLESHVPFRPSISGLSDASRGYRTQSAAEDASSLETRPSHLFVAARRSDGISSHVRGLFWIQCGVLTGTEPAQQLVGVRGDSPLFGLRSHLRREVREG